MLRTLEAPGFRVTVPELGVPGVFDGAVITAPNEEAAALGNKGGINTIVTHEAFGAKMHEVVRRLVPHLGERRSDSYAANTMADG